MNIDEISRANGNVKAVAVGLAKPPAKQAVKPAPKMMNARLPYQPPQKPMRAAAPVTYKLSGDERKSLKAEIYGHILALGRQIAAAPPTASFSGLKLAVNSLGCACSAMERLNTSDALDEKTVGELSEVERRAIEGFYKG